MRRCGFALGTRPAGGRCESPGPAANLAVFAHADGPRRRSARLRARMFYIEWPAQYSGWLGSRL